MQQTKLSFKNHILMAKFATKSVASCERWKTKFAWKPVLVDNKIIWFKFYRVKEVKILLYPKSIWLTLEKTLCQFK